MSGAGEVEDRLYGLLEVAERQQAAAQAALEGMDESAGQFGSEGYAG